MTWKSAILAGALAAGLSLSFVPKASADPRWKDNRHGRWQHQHHGNGSYRHHDRDRHDRDRHGRDWSYDARRRAQWEGWQRRHGDDRNWSRRDRWYDNRRSDGGWWHYHPSASSSSRYYGYPHRWANR